MKSELQKVGFSDTEATILMTLLENNRLTVSAISRLTGLKRTTIYSAADELVNKKVIQKDETNKIIYYILIDPSDIKNILITEKRKLKKREVEIIDLIRGLETIPRSKNFSQPRIQTAYGEDMYDFLYKRITVWNQSIIDLSNSIIWGFQDDYILEDPKFKAFSKWYWGFAPKSIELKFFGSNKEVNINFEKQVDKPIGPRRKFKFVDGLPFNANQWICGEYIINIVNSEKPCYIVEIRDRLMAENLRIFYKKIWENN